MDARLLLTLPLVLLVACGSDGNDSSSAGDPPPPAAAATEEPEEPDEPEAPPLKAPKNCPPPAPKLSLWAENVSWVTSTGKTISNEKACLTGVAEKPLAVTMFNDLKEKGFVKPGHNFSVYADSLAEEQLFYGDVTYAGEKYTYKLPKLDRDTYLFRCDLHPTEMNGVLVVR